MSNDYLLNRVINTLLEERMAVCYVSSNPITFNCTYGAFGFYIIWDMETMDNDCIEIVHRTDLDLTFLTMKEVFMYIDHANPQEGNLKISLTEEYIAYRVKLEVDPLDFKFEMLSIELDRVIHLVEMRDTHAEEIQEKFNQALFEHEKKILEQGHTSM